MNAPAAHRIRPGDAHDLPALVALYNHYVVETPITFDVEPYDVVTRRPWLDAYAEKGPHRLFVAERDDVVIGYATSSRFRPKAAYDRSVETTIYLHPEAVGRGLGRALYGHLLDVLDREPDVHRALAGITLPNAASQALHHALGFTPVGTYHEVGFKFGRYWDVGWLERRCA